MFEKEAEEYAENFYCTKSVKGVLANTWQDGAEYGYNKAKEELEKQNNELKEENKGPNVLVADIIEAFDSCSYNDDFEMAQAGKEIYELFYGGKDPKEVFHNAEVPKSSRQLLVEAKEIIKKFSDFVNNEVEYDPEYPQEHTDLWNKLCEEAEQFLKECEE